jgi:hypothetical protein
MNADTPEETDLEDRWPQDGDRLFIESNWAYDAHVVRAPKERRFRMPRGYKRAGDILIEQAGSDLIDRRNTIYPALFCYRQSIELYMKSLVKTFGKDETFNPKNTHDLARLWERFLRVANERGESESIGIDAAQTLVAEMQRADQKSDGFRFPTDTAGQEFAFGDRGIDLDNLYEVMQGLANFFDGFEAGFQAQDDGYAAMP